ncbi:MAG: PmoA family protein [Saprospiraceae bacterium]|nr:PmoA family protein [Saprospiraceae bacterium]
MKQPTLAGLFLVLASFHIAWTGHSQSFDFQRQEEGLLLNEQGKPVLFFQQTAKSLEGKYSRANYLHPLYDLDGNELSEDFPADHLHHRGIFWAWHEILVGGKKIGDAWDCDNISWDVKKVRGSASGEIATLKTRTYWESTLTEQDAKPTRIFKEKTRIEVHPSTAFYRVIDFTIQLKPLLPGMAIGGSTDTKGYGGFSPRIKLPEDLQFWGELGEVKAQRDGIEAGPWIDMLGSFNEGEMSGVAIMMHPQFPDAPQKWILRESGSMQNAAFPGNQAFALQKKEWLELRYRMVIHKKEIGKDTISKLYYAFISE